MLFFEGGCSQSNIVAFKIYHINPSKNIRCGTRYFLDYQLPVSKTESKLLIAKTVLGATVRTVPRNTITGYPPEIFIHTVLAHRKATPASPAEVFMDTTAMAGDLFG